jgi:serine protease
VFRRNQSRWARTIVATTIVAAVASRVSTQDTGRSPGMLSTGERLEAVRRSWNEGASFVPGDVLIKFRNDATTAQRSRAMTVVRGGVDAKRSEWIGDVLWASTPGESSVRVAAERLQAQPEVLWAQPNYFRRLTFVPDDPGYSRQWNLEAINMPRAWDINNGGSDKTVVAVVDSGITTVTESFEFTLWTGRALEGTLLPFRVNPDIGAGRIMSGRGFIFWNGPVLDMVGHGTHVAGTILQETNNGVGLAGIAHHARLLPLKACVGYWEIQLSLAAEGIPGFVKPDEGGGCSDALVARAIRFAVDSGAHIINISLGGPDPSPVLFDALQYAVSRKVFVTIAAGNDFTEGNPTSYPARYAQDLDGVVAVGAVGRGGRRAFYSNTGSYVELAAPGGDTRESGISGAIYQASLLEDDLNPNRVVRPRFDRYAEIPYQGTSMAAPHVAGIAALLYSQGTADPAAVEGALKSFARDLGSPGRDDEFGYGLVDAPASLRGRGHGVAR